MCQIEGILLAIGVTGVYHINESIVGIAASIYLFKVNNRINMKRYEICSKLTIKTPEQGQWSFFVVKLWTYFTHLSSVSIVDVEQINVCWRTVAINSILYDCSVLEVVGKCTSHEFTHWLQTISFENDLYVAWSCRFER